MPILESNYHPPFFLKNPHLATIIPNRFRTITGVSYSRERLTLKDGDFIDLDFSSKASNRLVLILHGLEGNSQRAYAKGIVRQANVNNWDACVFNQRGCSGEANHSITSYHSGKTDDLSEVIEFLNQNKNYDSIHLVGFSLGGNIMLKYLGEESTSIPSIIKSAVAVSVPIDLESSSMELAKSSNRIYMKRFLKSLHAKTLQKINDFPDCGISIDELNRCNNFSDFDNLYTAPIHGFKNAHDYWKKSSAKQFLSEIQIPTLLINALDDPFLSKECIPFDIANQSKAFHLITPKHGGHVGFVNSFPLSHPQYIENISFDFLKNQSV